MKEQKFLAIQKYIRTTARILGKGKDTDDLVQDAYLRIFGRIDRINDDVKVKGYSAKIVKNLIIDKYRREEAKGFPVYLEPIETDKVTNIDLGMSDKLVKALASLTTMQKNVFLLHNLYDYSLEEISKIFNNLNINTIKVHNHRAKKKLKEYYEKNRN